MPTLGTHPAKQLRVLKERRIASVSLRVSDLDPGLSYAVFLQNTPVLWDVVPRADALGWYALPRWGKGNDGVSDPAFDRCGLGAKCGNRGRRPRLQRRLGRLDGGFRFGFSVAGVADLVLTHKSLVADLPN